MQLRLDGYNVSRTEGRFTGTVELDDEDSESIALDRTVFFVVAARAGKAEFDVNADGEARRKDVLSVADAKVLTGNLREQALAYLTGTGTFMDLAVPFEGDPAEGEIRERNGRREVWRSGKWDELEVVDHPQPEPEDDLDVAVEAGLQDDEGALVESLGHVTERPEAQVSNGNGDGPKVAKWRPDEEAAGGVQDVETVGSMYGHDRDPALAAFLQES